MNAKRLCRHIRVYFWWPTIAITLFAAEISFSGETAVLSAAGAANPKSESESALKAQEMELKKVELVLTFLGSLVTIGTLMFGVRQYFKAEQWKRTEFLAKEMKDFASDPIVQNVQAMIDWSPRRVNLFLRTDLKRHEWPVVTRALQVTALLPHTLLAKEGGSDEEASDPASDPERREPSPTASDDADDKRIESLDWRCKAKFSLREARIRDCYDRFLDGLERFGGYLASDLVKRQDLDAYLKYWIDDIADFTKNRDDAAWTCLLFGYIDIYGFTGVQKLFDAYNYDIRVPGPLFDEQAKMIAETGHELAARVRAECVKRKPAPKRANHGAQENPTE